MKQLPLKLEKRLQKRKDDHLFRKLLPFSAGVDFLSNDYLGFSKSLLVSSKAEKLVDEFGLRNGSGGSRLLSGNLPIFEIAEEQLANFHSADAALIFNSGYDANLGFFSSVPQKDDLILYDEYAHASIRDGLKMSMAKNFKFRHNDLEDLRTKLTRLQQRFPQSEVYIVTESVFSMDGDSPDLNKMADLAEEFGAILIVDEAHAVGVFGERGEGLVQQLHLEAKVHVRIITFGKAIGAHGAAILGGLLLKEYLVNFCRSFIYTTALSPHSIATISAAYEFLEEDQAAGLKLRENIRFFRSQIVKNKLEHLFIPSESAIQACIISGNQQVRSAASELQNSGFNVRPILSPTIPAGSERLRFCLHSYNSEAEISEVLKVLGKFVSNN